MGFLIEGPIDGFDGLAQPLACGAGQIQQALDLGVVADYFAGMADIDQIERVQPVLLLQVRNSMQT